MTDREALLAIQQIVALALPDRTVTATDILADVAGVLATVGLDPIADVKDVTGEAEVVPFPDMKKTPPPR